MTTRVIVSSTHHRDYAFSLPIIGLLWREVVGFEPIFMLTRDEAFWRAQEERCSITLDALREHGFEIHFVGQLDGYEDGRLGQNAREHAGCLDLDDSTWVMMSDADLWPLAHDWYHQHDDFHGLAASYYCNGDNFVSKDDVLARYGRGERFQTIPTCHVVMRAWTWRHFYNCNAGFDVAKATKRTVDAWFAHLKAKDHNFELWMCDQDILTEKLCRQEWFPRDVLMIPRKGHPPQDRIDRCAWPSQISTQGITDAHIPKAPDQPLAWTGLSEIIRQVLPPRHKWAMKYRDRFAGSY